VKNKQHNFLQSSLFPLLFLLLTWAIFYYDNHYNLGLKQFGTEPRTLKGLGGIIGTPLLHGDLAHIISNSFPVLILGTLLFYFYTDIAFKVFFAIYFFSSALIWIFGRTESVHIGASGLVYGLSGFLFFSGIIRRHKGLFGVSLLVTFLYGSVIWGIFPTEFQQAIHYVSDRTNISWEGHLFGFAAGTALAYYYRRTGIQKPVYSWDINNDDDVDESNPYWIVENESESESESESGKKSESERKSTQHDIVKNTSDNPYTVNYTFVPKNKDPEDNDEGEKK
jgi:membrane associated rhomboid family serine protease